MTMLRWSLLALAGLLTNLAFTAAAAEPAARLVDAKKIWSEAAHNAFTDLIFHQGRWYCVFREGQGHISADGALRIITSTDGRVWTSVALITSPDADLRDAKISVAPDGSLCLCGAGAWHKPQGESHQSFLWYSKDGKDWGDAIAIGDPGYWIWRVIWHEGKAYGIGYRTKKGEVGTRLYESHDGRHFTAIVPALTGKEEGYTNEAGMIFLPDETMLAVIRRDIAPPSDALLGTAKPPYTQWEWKKLGVRVGGPSVLQLPDGRIVVAGRRHGDTQLWWLDPVEGKLTEILTLPSGGDTSYPGLVFHDGQLWVSYYSSHEGKTQIYLARVELP